MRYLSTLLIVFFISGCVTQRQFEDLEGIANATKTSLANCSSELSNKKEQLDKANAKIEDQETEIEELEKERDNLTQDTSVSGRRYRRLNIEFENLTKTLEKQRDLNKEMANESQQKNKTLYAELLALEKELQSKESKLNERDNNLRQLQDDVEAREKKVIELQRMIGEKDSMMQQLQKTISQALLNFKDKGISVEVKGDKVFVSLEEQILFASGKYEVDTKVKEALKQLATVLNNNPDIAIMVEGHTDTDPIKTKCIADNYDLSVLRATEIVRVLTNEGKVDPKRVVAAGRGEYMPVAPNNTAEGKKKNRRIEIVLTPNLDELYNLLNE